jgi:transcriptional regulator with XRE-family HTH domain
MKTPITTATLTPQQFTAALAALGWKQSDFCRKTGVSKQTPSRWALGQTPIQPWVGAYLGAMLDIKRLHAAYIATGDHIPNSPTEAPTEGTTPDRLAHVLAPPGP